LKVHLVGIGGAGVSALADVYLHRRLQVSGCDLKESATTRRLAAAGVRISIGHDPAHVEGQDLIVYSGAVRSSPELDAARAAGIRVVSRAEVLSELFRSPGSVAVTGSSGKTSVTFMLGQVLAAAGRDPTILVGDGTNTRAGRGPLVAEADESDGSLLLHHPRHAVVTNVAFDHPDHFQSIADVEALFARFLAGLPAEGVAVLGADDPRLRRLATPARRVTYGFDPGADYRCTEERPFQLLQRGRRLGPVGLLVPGRHNVQNATAAAAMALELGVEFEVVAGALGRYSGAARRLERLGTWRDAVVYDDYGHHPDKVAATLQAAREVARGRVILIFQPHRYSRFAALRQEFAAALAGADQVIVTEIYGAGESNPEGLSAIELAKLVPGAQYCPDFAAARAALEESVRPGDLVLCMGAGSITELAHELAG